jgi:hypothetical protein
MAPFSAEHRKRMTLFLLAKSSKCTKPSLACRDGCLYLG